MTAPPRPRFRWSLRTMFVVVAVCGTVGYWGFRQIAYQRAYDAYERTLAAWEAEGTTTSDLCEASLRLFRSSANVPFADRRKAADAHLARINQIRSKVYILADMALVGGPVSGPADPRQQMRDEVDRYYSEAKRLASQ